MPTRQRPKPRAPRDAIVDLDDAAARAGYARETLRKMMWTADPPPLFKYHGRWHARLSELDAWLTRRDGEAS
jgi:hypothetical protein